MDLPCVLLTNRLITMLLRCSFMGKNLVRIIEEDFCSKLQGKSIFIHPMAWVKSSSNFLISPLQLWLSRPILWVLSWSKVFIFHKKTRLKLWFQWVSTWWDVTKSSQWWRRREYVNFNIFWMTKRSNLPRISIRFLTLSSIFVMVLNKKIECALPGSKLQKLRLRLGWKIQIFMNFKVISLWQDWSLLK